MDRKRLEELPDFLTVDDVAKLLGISLNHAYKGIESGDIPADKIGRIYRISKAKFVKKFCA